MQKFSQKLSDFFFLLSVQQKLISKTVSFFPVSELKASAGSQTSEDKLRKR